jgi:RIC1
MLQASTPRAKALVADEPLHAFCLMPAPQSQPVLPCLLRRQLQHGHSRGAKRLARLHQHGPHFSRSLEWLLFTSLDHDFCQGDVSDTPNFGGIGPLGDVAEDGMQTLLKSAFELIRSFPQWRDVVVNVSRKTDSVMWPLLYSVIGKPSSVLQQLLHAGQVRNCSPKSVCAWRLLLVMYGVKHACLQQMHF